MDCTSYLRRTIFVPGLGLAVEFDVTEPSESITAFLASHPEPTEEAREDLEELLIGEGVALSGVSPEHFLSFSEWKAQTELLKSVVTDPEFAAQIVASFAGQDEVRAQALRGAIGRHTGHLGDLLTQYGELGQFVKAYVRNAVLGSAFAARRREVELRLPTGTTRVEGYGGSLFATASNVLADEGMHDVDCLRWARVTGALDDSPLPSVKQAYESLEDYEIPVASSPALSPTTLKQLLGFTLKGISRKGFERVVYAAAALDLGATAVGTSIPLMDGQAPSMLCVLGGVTTALMIVTVAPLSDKLASWLGGRGTRQVKALSRTRVKGKRKRQAGAQQAGGT